ncbi:MAG: hypothetical protein WBQ54_23770, partial [Pseudolabrys sp.]
VPGFLYQSIVAGVDVALRALNPRLPLQPGFVIYPMRLPPSAADDATALADYTIVFVTQTKITFSWRSGQRHRYCSTKYHSIPHTKVQTMITMIRATTVPR